EADREAGPAVAGPAARLQLLDRRVHRPRHRQLHRRAALLPALVARPLRELQRGGVLPRQRLAREEDAEVLGPRRRAAQGPRALPVLAAGVEPQLAGAAEGELGRGLAV